MADETDFGLLVFDLVVASLYFYAGLRTPLGEIIPSDWRITRSIMQVRTVIERKAHARITLQVGSVAVAAVAVVINWK